jgi:hypothetical protein
MKLTGERGEILARFFLDAEFYSDHTKDEEGGEYADLAAARTDAVQSLREMVANAIRGGDRAAPSAITVRDSAGRRVASVLTKEILPSGW